MHRKHLLYRLTLQYSFRKQFTFDFILFFKRPRLSQVKQRSAVVVFPVNNDVIDNDVVPSHQCHRMDSMSKVSKVS